jgi:hypothetical protein
MDDPNFGRSGDHALSRRSEQNGKTSGSSPFSIFENVFCVLFLVTGHAREHEVVEAVRATFGDRNFVVDMIVVA